jgi:hypothetical protein
MPDIIFVAAVIASAAKPSIKIPGVWPGCFDGYASSQ